METGRLLEKCGSPPLWLGIINGCFQWIPDSCKALRFARQQDAEDMAKIIEGADTVTEHLWYDGID